MKTKICLSAPADSSKSNRSSSPESDATSSLCIWVGKGRGISVITVSKCCNCPPQNKNYGLVKTSAPSVLASAFSTQNHVDDLLAVSSTENFNSLPTFHHPAVAGFSPMPRSAHNCFLCSPHHSALFPASEREVCERGTKMKHRGNILRKSQLGTPITTLKAHAAVNTLITQWNAAISIP